MITLFSRWDVEAVSSDVTAILPASGRECA